MARLNLSILVSPLLCLGLLGGIVAEDAGHLKPKDVEPYHARAKAVIESWPKTIADGSWTTSIDEKLPPSAEKLLHPNVVIARRYTSGTLQMNGFPVSASLLIVQCKDSRDMAGHYPPICYPAAGQRLMNGSGDPIDIPVAGTTVHAMEYHFLAHQGLSPYRSCVYDFFIVPGKGFVRGENNMSDVRRAAADYQRRFYGAAQFQVLMDADYPRELREKIFATLIGANPNAFDVLNTVEIQ